MSARSFKLAGPRRQGNITIRENVFNREVILHDTAVVVLNQMSNIVTLNTGGWKTRTTMTAINNALSQIPGFESLKVYQRKGVWYVGEHEFKDGMMFGAGFGAKLCRMDVA